MCALASLSTLLSNDALVDAVPLSFFHMHPAGLPFHGFHPYAHNHLDFPYATSHRFPGGHHIHYHMTPPKGGEGQGGGGGGDKGKGGKAGGKKKK